MSKKNEHVEARPERGQPRADERPPRVSLNSGRDILNVKGIKPDMHPVWVNEDQVPRFLDAGYTFVDYNVSFGSYHVNQGNELGARYARDVGMGMVAYLMEIPKSLKEEYDREEEERLRAGERAIYENARADGLDYGNILGGSVSGRSDK